MRYTITFYYYLRREMRGVRAPGPPVFVHNSIRRAYFAYDIIRLPATTATSRRRYETNRDNLISDGAARALFVIRERVLLYLHAYYVGTRILSNVEHSTPRGETNGRLTAG